MAVPDDDPIAQQTSWEAQLPDRGANVRTHRIHKGDDDAWRFVASGTMKFFVFAFAGFGGIGELLDPLPHVARTLTLLLPPLSCPTPAVFRAWDDLGGPVNDESPNDLEAAALAVVPELATWRDDFATSTGQRPTMAGSGATWFVDGEHPGPRRLVVRTTPVGWRPEPS